MKLPLFFLVLLLSVNLVFAYDDYYCFTKLKNNENIPSVVSSISDNLVCENGKCTCRLNSGEGYCLVCSDSSGWFAAFNRCNSDYCDPNEVITGHLDQFVKFPFENNGIYTRQRFYVEINTTRKSKVDIIDMTRVEGKNLCMHCNYIKKMMLFNEGFNDILIKSAVAGEVESERISFFIDTKKPRIIKTMPLQNQFASGEFRIIYDENNLDKVELFYGEKDTLNSVELNCESGKKECFTSIDLGDYEGKSIYFWFSLTDIAKNVVNSSKTKVYVDNKKPVINLLDYTFDNGFYNIEIGVSDYNFFRIVYLDSGKEKLFCSSLRDGTCSRKLKLNDNLIIKVIDRAGNFEERELQLE